MVDKVKLLNHNIDIILEENFSEGGHMGRAILSKCLIRLDKSMAKDAMASTLIHELVHIMMSMNSVEITEQTTDNIALGILSLLKDNEDILEGLR